VGPLQMPESNVRLAGRFGLACGIQFDLDHGTDVTGNALHVRAPWEVSTAGDVQFFPDARARA
jgi:hypothetical protein